MGEQIVKVKDFINKEKCDCGNVAIWLYLPSYSGEQINDFYCDSCVSRGCSCEWTYASKDAYGPEPLDEDILPEGIEGVDWKWIVRPKDEFYEEIKSGEIWVYIDKEGREYPCCEFMYKEGGWDKE